MHSAECRVSMLRVLLYNTDIIAFQLSMGGRFEGPVSADSIPLVPSVTCFIFTDFIISKFDIKFGHVIPGALLTDMSLVKPSSRLLHG